MRDYKFRGFDKVGNKGWVYGDLTHNQKVTRTGLEPRVMVGGYEVVPESVSLCTGIKDENGAMTYGGDIVDVSYEGKHLFNATIVWLDKYGGFFLDEGNGCFSHLPYRYITVIGTVYEKRVEDKRKRDLGRMVLTYRLLSGRYKRKIYPDERDNS